MFKLDTVCTPCTPQPAGHQGLRRGRRHRLAAGGDQRRARRAGAAGRQGPRHARLAAPRVGSDAQGAAAEPEPPLSNTEGESIMYAFTFERPSTVADAARLAACRRQAAGRRPDPAGLDEAAPGATRAAGRPGRHQGTGRHPQGRQHPRDRRHGAPCRRRRERRGQGGLSRRWPTWPAHIGDRQVRAMGTIGGSVANNDPAACYPSAVLASGATVDHEQARDRGRRLLPGPVRHGAGGRRTDHRDPLSDPEARGLREVQAEGLAASR